RALLAFPTRRSSDLLHPGRFATSRRGDSCYRAAGSSLSPEVSMGIVLARNWWAFAIRGLLGILFGVIAFTLPAAAMLSLVFLFRSEEHTSELQSQSN